MQILDLHISKTDKVWDVDAQGPWVSKTDLVEFERCSYRVFLAHQEQKPYNDYRTPFALLPLLAGQDHEKSVESNIELVETEDIAAARAEGGVYKVPLRIYNHDYGMVGVLDAIWFKENVLFPVEIKMHSRFRTLDRQELVFYWRLLEPLQSIDVPKENRKGYLFLGNSPEPREILLRSKDLRVSEFKVPMIREAKGKDPGFSLVKECGSCVLEEKHKAEVLESLALDLVYDVGPVYKKIFKGLGIMNVGDLAHAEPTDILRGWSETTDFEMPEWRLERMQAHADSWLSGEPEIIDGAQIPFPSEAIILDLEYSTWANGYIFLAGMLVVTKDSQVFVKQEFASDSDDELRVLGCLEKTLAAYPEYPIVTYNGLSADFPQIKKAWRRHDLSDSSLADFERRHIDLFQVAVRAIRLPIPGLGLKLLSDHFKFKRKVPGVTDGLAALMMYTEFLSSRNAELKTMLMGYNEDDLNATLFVWKKMWEIANGPK